MTFIIYDVPIFLTRMSFERVISLLISSSMIGGKMSDNAEQAKAPTKAIKSSENKNVTLNMSTQWNMDCICF